VNVSGGTIATHPGPSRLGLPSYADLKLTIDNIPDLVVRMGMFVDPSPGLNRVVGECHVLRMKETPSPAFSWLRHVELIRVNEHHDRAAQREVCRISRPLGSGISRNRNKHRATSL
jgi:hypothetical protein